MTTTIKNKARGKKTPSVKKKTPTAVKKTPSVKKKTPTAVKKTPLVVKKTPSAKKKTPTVVKKTPLVKKGRVHKGGNDTYPEITNRGYTIIQQLGTGSFGSTFLVKKDGKKYVIKRILIKRGTNPLNEVEILKKIQENGCHPNVLCYVDSFQTIEDNTQKYLYIVTEALENAITIQDFISTQKNPLPSYILLYIMRQLLSGLKYIHDLNIGHGDIKDLNVIINPRNYKIQIIDFGSSCTKDECLVVGSVLYSPLELLLQFGKKNKINVDIIKKADIFSTGILLYYIANLQLPKIIQEAKSKEQIPGIFFITSTYIDIKKKEDAAKKDSLIKDDRDTVFISNYKSGDENVDNTINNTIHNMILIANPEKRLTVTDNLIEQLKNLEQLKRTEELKIDQLQIQSVQKTITL